MRTFPARFLDPYGDADPPPRGYGPWSGIGVGPCHIASLARATERADEARARASEMHGIETEATKATMLQIAKMYDEMAQRAEARERLKKDAEARRGTAGNLSA